MRAQFAHLERLAAVHRETQPAVAGRLRRALHGDDPFRPLDEGRRVGFALAVDVVGGRARFLEFQEDVAGVLIPSCR